MPPKMIVSSPTAHSSLVAPALMYPLHRAHLFLVGCPVWNIVTRPSKAKTHFIYVFFALLNPLPQMKRQHPPIRSAPAALPLHHPSRCFCQLFVDCCFFWPNGSHLRPTPLLSLCFLMCLVLLPQTRELAIVSANPVLGSCNEPIGSDSAMIWWRCCPIHGERGKAAGGLGGSSPCWLLCVVLCCVLWFKQF